MLEACTEISEVSAVEEIDEISQRKVYRCKHCKTTICSVKDKIEVENKFEHTFFNPGGVVFTIGCFAQAINLKRVGEPVLEFTWFKGCAWQVALCQKCRHHLGWFYAGAAIFWGLILTELELSRI